MQHRIRDSGAGALALALAVHLLPLRAEDILISESPTYCEDLLRIIDVAATKKKFSVISGRVREGEFLDTTLPLAGWKDCALYGARTYTCDSHPFGTATAAEKALTDLVKDITTCLGEGWALDKSRSSPEYVILQHAQGVLSMTLSTDAISPNEHTIRLILLVRGRPYENQ